MVLKKRSFLQFLWVVKNFRVILERNKGNKENLEKLRQNIISVSSQVYCKIFHN